MKTKIAIMVMALLLCKAVALVAGNASSKRAERKKLTKTSFLQRAVIDYFVLSGTDSTPDSLIKYLDRGIGVNEANGFGTTALMAAALNNRTQNIDLLLEHGACAHQMNGNGHSAIYTFLSENDPDKLDKHIVRSLLRCRCTHLGSDPKFQMPEQLIASLRKEDNPGKADFVEWIEGGMSRTVAEIVLNPVEDKDRIFPRYSPINDIILSYISTYQETPAERQDTLQRKIAKETHEK